jgi:flagellar protein FlgJ
MTPREFFVKYAPDAEQAMIAKGIPASVTLAQAAIESAYGAAAYGNNFFGIKAGKSWTGKTQLLRTTEVLSSASEAELAAKKGGFHFPSVISITARPDGKYLWKIRDNFRAYDSARDGFIDHANFFIVNSRYHQAILDEANAEKFAEDIADAGYATAPNYGQTIINVIRKYNLLAYDGEAHQLAAKAAGVDPHKIV